MRDIPHSQPLQETQTSELCETFLILSPLKRHKRANYAGHSSFSTPSRDTNERIMRDIPHFQPLQETQTSELCETFLILNPFRRHKRANYARHSSFPTPSRDTNERIMRDIPHFQPLQETQKSELRETSFILHPLRCTNERIMRDIPHFHPLQETQTSELCETSFILHPLRCTNERIMRDILHFTPSKMHKRANYARHSS